MKKITILLLSVTVVFNSCISYGGAITGGSVAGSLLGSAIGGILGGPRGSDIGTIIGGLGGMAAGTGLEMMRAKKYEEAQMGNQPRAERQINRREKDNQELVYTPLSIHNLQLIDNNNDHSFNRGETCTLVFELRNNAPESVSDVQLEIKDLDKNKHLSYSTLPLIENIASKQKLRITAYVYADEKLKDGTARFAIFGAVGNEEAVSLIEFTAPTKK